MLGKILIYAALCGWAVAPANAMSVVAARSHPPTGQVERVFPDERTFLLNVPDDYEHGTAHALVLSYHGAGGNSSNQERLTQLADPSLRLNGLPILSAFPQGVNNTDYDMTNVWQGAPYANASVDDVKFTKCIVADISQNYTIDPRRIYISGKSNGGGFANLAACHPELSTLFAAFAPVSAALYPNTGGFGGLLCSPARAVPLVNSHGVEDTTAPFHGRSAKECGNGPLPDIEVWRQQWADRNAAIEYGARGDTSAVGNGTVSQSFTDVTNTTWSGDGLDIVGLTVDKLGHSWPTTAGLDQSGRPNNTATFNFTSEVMIPFFDQHVLPEEYVKQW